MINEQLAYIVTMKLPRRFQPIRLSITLACTAAVVLLFLSGFALFELFELKSFDLRFLARGPLPVSEAVVVAVVDEKSLAAEGRWPWPRSKMATLVERLSADGAGVIGFDIGFLEPDQNSHLALISDIEQHMAGQGSVDDTTSAYLAQRKTQADNDRRLAQAMADAEARIVLGYFFHMDPEAIDFELDQSETDRRIDLIDGAKYPLVRMQGADAAQLPVATAVAPQPNIAPLVRAADGSGFFNKLADADGAVRSTPLIIRCRDGLYASLAIQAIWHYLDRPTLVVHGDAHGVAGIQMGDMLIPTDEAGNLLVNHLGPEDTIPTYSVTDILNQRLPPGTFTDRIVLVGGAAMGIADFVITPFSPVAPGLTLHATIVENILTGRTLEKPQWTIIFDLLAIMLAGLTAGFFSARLQALHGLLANIGLLGAYILLNRWLFIRHGLWLGVVYPIAALALVYLAQIVYHYFTETKERRRVRNTFQRYLSGDVIDQMLANPDQLQLGGEVRVLTILFTDLEGFTSYAENRKPNEFVTVLNEYFSQMTEEIFQFGGTLLEFLGDGMMVMFGAPIANPGHAADAVRTAMAMQTRLAGLQQAWARPESAFHQRWKALGSPALKTRIGVNSGDILVGNLGSRQRFSYSVLGDEVNLASRLEGLNKQYGTRILLGENTAGLVGDDLALLEIDLVQVVGKQQPIRIFEPIADIGRNGPLPVARQLFMEAYTGGLEAYRRGDWKTAATQFETAGQNAPGHNAWRVMTERCRHFLATPPDEPWDGLYRATKK